MEVLVYVDRFLSAFRLCPSSTSDLHLAGPASTCSFLVTEREEITCVRVRSPLAIVRPPPLTVIQLKLKAPSTGTGQRASLFLTLSPSDYAPHSGRAFNLVRELRYVLGDGRVGMICKSVCSAGIHTRSFGSSRQLVSIGVAWGDGLVLVPSFVEWRAYPFHVA